eukprot:5335723-Amphidinium_carterae.1
MQPSRHPCHCYRRHNRQTAAQQIVKEPRVGAGREDIAVAHSDGVASQGSSGAYRTTRNQNCP